MPAVANRRPHGRVELQRHSAREKRALDAVFVKQIQEAPDPRPAAVLVDGLHGEIAVILGVRPVQLCQAVGVRIAQPLIGFRALFVVDHEVDGDLGVVGPDNLRRPASVPEKITWTNLSGRCHDSPPSMRLLE